MISETFSDKAITDNGKFKLQYFEVQNLNKKIVVLSRNLARRSHPLIRIQFGCFFGTTFGIRDCDCDLQLHESIKQIDKYNNGALIYLPDDDGRGIGLSDKIDFMKLQRKINAPPIQTAQRFHIKYEDFSILEIMPELFQQLGIKNDIIFLSNSPQKSKVLLDLGIKIKETKSLRLPKNKLSKIATREIDEKRKLLGHNF